MEDLWTVLLLGAGTTAGVVILCTMLSRRLRGRRPGP
jgi:hypothetical protein